MKKFEFKKIEYDFDFENNDFKSIEEDLNYFFFNKAIDFIKHDLCQMYGLFERKTLKIIGYIAISCSRISSKELETINQITNYVPGVLIGRLSIDINYIGKRYGTYLIKKAITISKETSRFLGCRVLIVDALLNVINFYKRIGFNFVDSRLGQSVLEKLERGMEIERNSVQMYFDLQKI